MTKKTDKLPLFSAERTAYYLTKDSSVETVREFISDMQRGWYPLDYIIGRNHLSFDINAQDKDGNTFWHYNLEICPQYKPNNITLLTNLCQATGQEIDLRRKNKKGVSVLGSLIDHPDNPLIFEDLIIYDAMYNSDNYIDYTAQNDVNVYNKASNVFVRGHSKIVSTSRNHKFTRQRREYRFALCVSLLSVKKIDFNIAEKWGKCHHSK